MAQRGTDHKVRPSKSAASLDRVSDRPEVGDDSTEKDSSLSYLVGENSNFGKNSSGGELVDAERIPEHRKPRINTPPSERIEKVIIADPEPQKPSNSYLYVILTMNLFIAFGQSFVFDFPQSLEDPLMLSLKVDTFKISLLYSVYSLPNLIFSPIAGYVIEVIGCHNSAVIYTALIFFGQTVIYAGVLYKNFWIVFLGRGIYGVGGEGITILQLTINELWFYGNFLSVSVAWCDIVAVLGLLLGNFLNPEFLTRTRTLDMTFFVAALTCFGSALFGLGYYIYHRKYQHELDKRDQMSIDESFVEDELDDMNKTKLVNDKTQKFITTGEENDVAAGGKRPAISFGFKSIRYFSATYWILCVAFLFLANCYYQFSNISTSN